MAVVPDVSIECLVAVAEVMVVSVALTMVVARYGLGESGGFDCGHGKFSSSSHSRGSRNGHGVSGGFGIGHGGFTSVSHGCGSRYGQ